MIIFTNACVIRVLNNGLTDDDSAHFTVITIHDAFHRICLCSLLLEGEYL